jgi:hypothetical protein
MALIHVHVQSTGCDVPKLMPSVKQLIAANVSQNIKFKIISGAYVDIALLLDNTNVVPSEKLVHINDR